MPSIPKILTPESPDFPDPNQALKDPNGLLAIGGDLHINRLMHAYQLGIFPWYREGDPILWWSPDPRAVLFLEKLKISHSLKKALAKKDYTVTFDQAFIEVIEACAAPRIKYSGTWITHEMLSAYIHLHQAGYAHSVEVWQNKQLIGGLYGVDVGTIFCGESMFSRKPNASKIALVYLVAQLKNWGYRLIDCQIANAHLKKLGAEEMRRMEFLRLLQFNSIDSPHSAPWKQ